MSVPGAIEHHSGYPMIDPATINPQMDWPGVQQAQADWLAGRIVDSVADEAELAVRFSGLLSTDQRLVTVRSDQSLRWWSGTAWLVVAGGSPAWTAYSPSWRNQEDASLVIGNGSAAYRWRRDGRTIHVTGELSRGSSTNTGSAGDHYRWSLPVAARSFASVLGTARVQLETTANRPCQVFAINSTTIVMAEAVNGVRVGNAVSGGSLPAPAAGQVYAFSLSYEAAS